MVWRFFIAISLLALQAGGADLPQAVTSRSGQFIAHGRSGPELYVWPPASAKGSPVPLEPELLVVSAERIRKAFLNDLRLGEQVFGRIHLVIRPDIPPDSLIQIVSTRFNDNWSYRIDFPSRLDEARLVRAVSHALLLDLANGTTASRSAELPLWLTEGCCRMLLSEIRPGYLLRPPTAAFAPGLFVSYGSLNLTSKTPYSEVTGAIDPLARVRQTFQERSPLSFEDLSLKAMNEISGEQQLVYEDSAQYFLHELLKLGRGCERLVAMIRSLPDCWNWQTAFFTVYRDQFSNMREAEKWWSLAKLELDKQVSPSNPITSLEQLRRVLVTDLGVRTNSANVPNRTEAPLQEVVRQCSFDDQRQILPIKIQQLVVLAFRCKSDVLPIIEGYRAALQNYLNKRGAGPSAAVEPRLDPASRDRMAANELIRQLDFLDQKRIQAGEGQAPKETVKRSARK